jgi:hypothetical protein
MFLNFLFTRVPLRTASIVKQLLKNATEETKRLFVFSSLLVRFYTNSLVMF